MTPVEHGHGQDRWITDPETGERALKAPSWNLVDELEDRINYVIGGLQGAAMTLDHKLIAGQKEHVADFLRDLAEMLVEETRVLRDE